MDLNLKLNSFEGIADNSAAVPVSPDTVYEALIIGGGPAAMTAAVYLMRKGINTALVTDNFGGQVVETSGIENYMGYRYIEGAELALKFREQLQKFRIAVKEKTRVLKIMNDTPFSVMLSDETIVKAQTIIIASGKTWKKLDIPGEKEFTGRGVAYCTICDAPLFRDRNVVVVGGGNSGVESAIDLAKIASHVTVVQNLSHLTADRTLIDAMMNYTNISIIPESIVTGVSGRDKVESVSIRSLEDSGERDIPADGVFIAVGLVPNSAFAAGVVTCNRAGEIEIDSRCATSVRGIFAAGDVTTVPFKQIIIAAGEGAKAALSAHDYLFKTG